MRQRSPDREIETTTNQLQSVKKYYSTITKAKEYLQQMKLKNIILNKTRSKTRLNTEFFLQFHSCSTRDRHNKTVHGTKSFTCC